MGKHHSAYYIGAAQKHGLRVVNGGSHVKIYGPEGRGFMCVPRHRELSNGVERSIKAWLFKLGIIAIMILMTMAVAYAGL